MLSSNINFLKDKKMAWTKPMISEISVGLEINSYACAEKQFQTIDKFL